MLHVSPLISFVKTLIYDSDNFGTLSLLYMPAEEWTDVRWVSARDCVWEGPEWLRSKRRLNIARYRSLEVLFKTVLEVPNASLLDILVDLVKMKEENRGSADEVETIYDYLWREFQTFKTDESQKELQYVQIFSGLVANRSSGIHLKSRAWCTYPEQILGFLPQHVSGRTLMLRFLGRPR